MSEEIKKITEALEKEVEIKIMLSLIEEMIDKKVEEKDDI